MAALLRPRSEGQTDTEQQQFTNDFISEVLLSFHRPRPQKTLYLSTGCRYHPKRYRSPDIIIMPPFVDRLRDHISKNNLLRST